MSVGPAQVDVQAPPGLESVVFPGEAGRPTEAPAPGGAAGGPTATELREQLIKEVSEAVRVHVETKTAAAVESVLSRGQRAMQFLQQQQQAQTERLQGQLAACVESYRNLERENAVLKASLESLMKHLTLVLGPPPCVPPPAAASRYFPPSPPRAFGAQAAAAAAKAAAAASASHESGSTGAVAGPPPPQPESPAAPAASASAAGSPDATAARGDESPRDEESATARRPPSPGASRPSVDEGPGTSAEAAAPESSDDAIIESGPAAGKKVGEASSPATTVGASSSSVMTTPTTEGRSSPDGRMSPTASAGVPPLMTPAPAASFTLTLRRADNVPLGLDVQAGDSCLLVEAVRPGGAVEAWNRQCAGESREVRAGDRILAINGAEDVDDMFQECLKKHLLRMTMSRDPSKVAAAAAPGGSTRTTGGLRAEAHEFVPLAGAAPLS